MAITKIISIKNRLDQRVAYALNQEKTTTEKYFYETAINCLKQSAYEKMMMTKQRYDKKGGVQGYHVIQSFAPDEITPELAHQIGVEFAKRCFGNKYEVVVGTHLDKNHLHNHVIFNSVSFVDGRKFRNNFKDYYGTIRNTSDELCERFKLSVVEKSDTPKSMNYVEWRARQTGATTYQSVIRDDIDKCIKLAFNFGNFLYLMETKGYEIKQGKYISFRPYNCKHFSRGYKLGHKYNFENIKRKIAGKDLTLNLEELKATANNRTEYVPYPKAKKGSFKALCLHYMYLLGQIKSKEAPDEVITVCKEDLQRFEELISNVNFIAERNFKTVEQVERYINTCYEKLYDLKFKHEQKKEQYANKEPQFKALKQLKFYEKPYTLYLEGYHEMKDEYNLYMYAKEQMDTNTSGILDFITNLETDYSNYKNDMSVIQSDIQDIKKEIKKSKKALELHEQAEKRVSQIENHRVSIEHNRESFVRDMARKLSER